MSEHSQLIVKVSRDSVCAGDDMTDHKAGFFAEKSATLAQLVQLAVAACPLAMYFGWKGYVGNLFTKKTIHAYWCCCAGMG